MNVRRFHILVALFLAGSVFGGSDAAHAFGSGNDRGSVGFKSLLFPPSARVAALGGAVVAMPGNPTSLAANPAGAAGVRRRYASLSATNYVLDILPVSGVFVYPTRHGAWSFSASNVSYGNFDRVDELAGANGTFGAGDIAFRAGWARTLRYGFSGGISVGWVRSSIAEYSAAAIVANLGLLWEMNEGQTAIGFSVMNLGSALSSYVGGDQGLKDDVPTAFHIGAMHHPAHFPIPLALLADLAIPRDNEVTLSVAAEARPARPLALRVGYDSLIRYVSATGPDGGRDRRLALDDRRSGNFGGLGLSLGMGLVWGEFGLDYAYSLAGPFGGVHQLTVGYTW